MATNPHETHDDVQRRKKILVLVVEDYDDAREMYREYLEYMGYEVIVAADGPDAVATARRAHPDIILMDVSLPLMDGLEATRRLKSASDTKEIPVVALTGHVMAGSVEAATRAGCDSFIPKPALPDVIDSKIRTLLSGGKTRPATLLREAKKQKG